MLLFGIPYQYTLSHVLRARLNYMREKYQIKDNDFLTFDALRQSAQCVGRVIRSKTDYGVVILADSRYNRVDKRSKFPPWIMQFVRDQCLNLATDAAIDQIKAFLRLMGQPIEQEALHSILMNEDLVKVLSHSSFVNAAASASSQSIIHNSPPVGVATGVQPRDATEPALPSQKTATDIDDEDDFGMAVYNDVSSSRGRDDHHPPRPLERPTSALSEIPVAAIAHKSLFLLEDLLDG